MTKDLIRLLGLDEQDDFDLSDNPLSQKSVRLEPNEFFVIASDDYFDNINVNSLEIIKGDINAEALKFYMTEVERVESRVYSYIFMNIKRLGAEETMDLVERLYDNEESAVILYKMSEDTYFLLSREDDAHQFMIGYNSPFKRQFESTLSKKDEKLHIAYESELDDLIQKLLISTRWKEVRSTEPTNHFVEFGRDYIDASNVNEDFDLSDNPLSSNLFKDRNRTLEPEEVEKFCKSINNDKFKFSNISNPTFWNESNVARFIHFINDELALYFKVQFDDQRRFHEEKPILKVCTSIGFTKTKENSYRVYDSIALQKGCQFVSKSDNNQTIRDSINSKMDAWSRSLINGYQNNNSYIMKALEDLDNKMN